MLQKESSDEIQKWYPLISSDFLGADAIHMEERYDVHKYKLQLIMIVFDGKLKTSFRSEI